MPKCAQKTMGVFERVLAESTPEELKRDLLEAARLIRVEREWRKAGCPPGVPYFDDEGEHETAEQARRTSAHSHRRV